MTQESPFHPKEDYIFPNNYFRQLNKYDSETEIYQQKRRDLYMQLSRETELPNGRIEEVNRFLQEGKVGLAQDLTHEILEE